MAAEVSTRRHHCAIRGSASADRWRRPRPGQRRDEPGQVEEVHRGVAHDPPGPCVVSGGTTSPRGGHLDQFDIADLAVRPAAALSVVAVETPVEGHHHAALAVSRSRRRRSRLAVPCLSASRTGRPDPRQRAGADYPAWLSVEEAMKTASMCAGSKASSVASSPGSMPGGERLQCAVRVDVSYTKGRSRPGMGRKIPVDAPDEPRPDQSEPLHPDPSVPDVVAHLSPACPAI